MSGYDAGAIGIIGGGVIGVTTAVTLRLLGYQTILYARVRPSFAPGVTRPAGFATLHAAASVLPHSVSSPKVEAWTSVSQAFFRALWFRGCCGVRRQTHYEVFEDKVTVPPSYAGSVEDFTALDGGHSPKRSGVDDVYGWKFNAFFCEAGDYIDFLYGFYAALGGQMLDPPGHGSLPDYWSAGHVCLVNCAGLDAYALLASAAADPLYRDEPDDGKFDRLMDPVSAKLIRGHTLRIDLGLVPEGEVFSYNYKPVVGVYQTDRGLPADVYCYPRAESWLLGGSRQEGLLDDRGVWVGEETRGEVIPFPAATGDPILIPAAIWRLNADLLSGMTQGRLDLERLVRDEPSIVAPGIGYRFVRDSPTDSVRVGASRARYAGATRYILHNYGHGGSGYTLSWGCGADIARMIGPIMGPPFGADRAIWPRFSIGHGATARLLSRVLESQLV